MCGFSGIAFANDQASNAICGGRERFKRDAERVAHRGDSDHKERFEHRLWLSHYRLAFQDPGKGAQPMLSHDGQHVIVFNGEVYNHLQLRREEPALRGIDFRTRSDTETLVEGWKVLRDGLFPKLEGEYAFVICAIDGSEIIAHRDRCGVKPLFLGSNALDTRRFAHCEQRYGFTLQELAFASEIKGLCQEKRWDCEGLRRQFVGLFEPIRTPFRGVIHIPPGGRLKARQVDGAYRCELLPAHSAPRGLTPTTSRANADELGEALGESVRERLLSDVELGVYLSGGIDSKAIAYEIMRAPEVKGSVKSFTLGFRQQGYDESTEALRFAKRFGLAPHLMFVDDQALRYSYPRAVYNSELVQPFTNGAAKWWLSRFAREYVAGVLTGDGADEMFCGYPSYRYAMWWKGAMRARGPVSTLEELRRSISNTPLGTRVRDSLYVQRFSSHASNPWLAGSSAAGTGADFLDSLDVFGAPHPLFGQISAIGESLLGKDDSAEWLRTQAASVRSWFGSGLTSDERDLIKPEHALVLWQNYFLKAHFPVLVSNWVGDRMEMANTLEGRTPFLSTKIAKVVSRLRDADLVAGLREKAILRRAYRERIGTGFSRTPKKQFNAPFIGCEDKLSGKEIEDAVRAAVDSDAFSFDATKRRISAISESAPYIAAHLRSSVQTAVALALLDRTLIAGEGVESDARIEQAYLANSGPWS